MNDSPNQAVIVLGMHRSGTSVLTGVLSMLGIDSGEHLIPAKAAVNPKGFWEHAEIVDLHEQLLEMLGSSWDDFSSLPDLWWTNSEVLPFKSRVKKIVQRDFGLSPVWLLKDPRLCRLLPLWLDVLHELECKPYFIVCLRNPFEVAASLNKRDGIISDEAYLLWLRHVLDSERWSRGYPRTVVTYESVLIDWKSVIAALEQYINVSLRGEEPEIAKKINEFIEPGLRHHAISVNYTKTPGTLSELAAKTYQLMIATPIEDVAEHLSSISNEVDELCTHYMSWADKIRQLRKQIGELELKNSWQQSELCRIKSTVSWQLTKPLRFCAFMLRHLNVSK